MNKEVLILQFNSQNHKRINVPIKNYKPNLEGQEVKTIMEAMIASKGLVTPEGERAYSIFGAYYSIQIIENIILYNGDIQEQLKL